MNTNNVRHDSYELEPAFVATCILARCIDNIPGLHLHASPEEEEMGMDEAEVCSNSHAIESSQALFTLGHEPRLANMPVTLSKFNAISLTGAPHPKPA